MSPPVEVICIKELCILLNCQVYWRKQMQQNYSSISLSLDQSANHISMPIHCRLEKWRWRTHCSVKTHRWRHLMAGRRRSDHCGSVTRQRHCDDDRETQSQICVRGEKSPCKHGPWILTCMAGDLPFLPFFFLEEAWQDTAWLSIWWKTVDWKPVTVALPLKARGKNFQ